MAVSGFAADELQPSARQTFIWTPKGREIDQLANVVARKLCYRMDQSHGKQESVEVYGESIGPRDDSNADQVREGQTVETTMRPRGKAGRPTKQAQAREARKQETQEKRAATRAENKANLPTASQAKSDVKDVSVRRKGEEKPVPPPTQPPVQIQPTYASSAELQAQADKKAKLAEQVRALSPRERKVYDDKMNEFEKWFMPRSDVDIQLALDFARLPPSTFIDLMTDENGRKAIIAKVMALIKKGKK
mgnify:FL=1